MAAIGDGPDDKFDGNLLRIEAALSPRESSRPSMAAVPEREKCRHHSAAAQQPFANTNALCRRLDRY